jgi:hypothetical protein
MYHRDDEYFRCQHPTVFYDFDDFDNFDDFGDRRSCSQGHEGTRQKGKSHLEGLLKRTGWIGRYTSLTARKGKRGN